MEKMKMETPDMTARNVETIEKLFPNCVTETKDENDNPKKAVNFDLLRQMLSADLLEGDEANEFTWVGKKAAIVEANRPIRKTLRPCKEESVDWDHTENLYIEGDNLEVLKLLQESYLGKVKMIYIDPPYNTGNDFIYRDDYVTSADWCSMIYPRLLIARNLLAEDGVIFISIDDNEQENLKKICDEVFGGQNFVAQLVWERAYSPKNDARYISNSHDYVLMYARRLIEFTIGRLPRTEEANARYSNPDNDPRGVWKPSDLSVKSYTQACDYPITTPSGRVTEPPAGRCWRLSKKAFFERLQDNRIWFGPDGNGVPRMKTFLSELRLDGMAPTSILFYKEVGHSQEGTQEVSKLLGGGFFNGPKPQRLMKRLLTLANPADDDIVFDFFSGSASLAHAVMQLNADNSSKRKFIMVQIPESCDEKTVAYKAGYKNICEIGKERIRRAGKKIKEENPLTAQDLDIGFRVFKLDESNMNDVYYSAGEITQKQLPGITSNIKEDRTDLDLFFGCLLDWGLTLSEPYASETIEGFTLHTYCGDDLIACFDENITESAIRKIAQRKPRRAVFRDSCFKESPDKINLGEIFKTLSPGTKIKVI